MDQYVCGTCDQMCSPRESQMRTRERLLHFFETNPPPSPLNRQLEHVCVAEFSRSAAGTRTARPADLRSPDALRRTVVYLIDRILFDARKPFWFVYEFVFDRMRSIRREIVVQNLGEAETIGLLEPIVMFLAYSSYRLCEASIDHFDPYVCHQHLQECLKKLLCCYDAAPPDAKSLRNRAQFEAMYLVFNLGKAAAIARGLSVQHARTMSWKGSALVQMCVRMSLCYYANNYCRVLAHMQRLPTILAGLAALKLQTMRRTMLQTFAHAYHNKVHAVPLQWLNKVLLYSEAQPHQRLVADLKHYNCQLSASGAGVLFAKGAFDAQIDVIKPRQEVFVNRMFGKDCDLIEMLLVQG